jgi:hypothetical protein
MNHDPVTEPARQTAHQLLHPSLGLPTTVWPTSSRCLEKVPVKSLGIRVTDTVYAGIKAAAERDKRSMANWIALAIDEKLTRSSEGEQADRDRGE